MEGHTFHISVQEIIYHKPRRANARTWNYSKLTKSKIHQMTLMIAETVD